MEELPAPSHSSPEPELEHPVGVTTKSRKHSVFTHFPKGRNCDICLKTRKTKASCRRRSGEAPFYEQKSLVTWSLSINKSSTKDVNPETIIGTLSWCKILPLSGFKLFRAKQKLLRRRTDNSIEFGKAREDLSWNHPHFNTSSIRDTWHRWKSRSSSQRRHISSIATVRIGWKVLGGFYGMQLPSAKCPRPLGRRENATWKTIWRIIQRASNTFWSNGWIWDQARIHQCGKKVLPGILLGYELIAVWIWKGDIFIADLEELEKLDASEIYLRRINATEVLIRQRQDEFIFPIADGPPKLPAKDNEFRKPILWQEQPGRSEDLSGEIQGESGESQSAQPTDDAGARADFWSMQGAFIYRHHNEPRVQLCVPKEEKFPIPLKYIWCY